MKSTRAVRAQKLLERLQRGPASLHDRAHHDVVQEMQNYYQLWVETWILPELQDLIPELRKRQVNT